MPSKSENSVDEAIYLTPTPAQVGLGNRCPRCGEGRLYDGVLNPAKSCMNCGLDFKFIDSGDGPAVFVILIIGFFVTALAMTLQTALEPPLWVHMALWIPVVTILSVWALRITKGIMIALQYQTMAQEGELGEDS
ncbi:MAG: DUF983 domain-containing protein [Rhizobiaceae bacterium]